MDWLIAIAFLWMTVLSIAVGYLAWSNAAMRRRTHELDLSEQLHFINRHITLDMIRRDDAMNRAIRAAIRCFEETPLLMEKYWGDYNALKQFLKS